MIIGDDLLLLLKQMPLPWSLVFTIFWFGHIPSEASSSRFLNASAPEPLYACCNTNAGNTPYCSLRDRET